MQHKVLAVIIGALAILLVAVPVIAYFKKKNAAPAALPTVTNATKGTAPAAKPAIPAQTDLGGAPTCPAGTHLETTANGALVCVADLPSTISEDPADFPLLPTTAVVNGKPLDPFAGDSVTADPTTAYQNFLDSIVNAGGA